MLQAVSMRLRWIFMLWLVFCRAAAGDAGADAGWDSNPGGSEERSVATLNSLADSLDAAIREADSLAAELETNPSDDRKRQLTARLEAERERIGKLRANFRDLVGGVEAADFEPGIGEKISLQDQISELLDPLVGSLRETTSKLREADALRGSLVDAQVREKQSARVIMRIDDLLKRTQHDRVRRELESLRRTWSSRQAEAAGKADVLKLQLEEMESNTPGVWESVSQMVSDFWKTRGINLLLALVAAVAGFFAVRRSYRWLRKVNPLHRGGKSGLMGRVSDIAAVVLAVLVAIIAVLLVFYLRGDWLLLTLAAVLLFGAAWAGKTALPPYIEQIRLLLNIGPVREGERLIYRDLPWNVSKLGFQTILSNPELEGGELRIPLRDLMSMISRQSDPHEPWFPTRKHDWVILQDETYGKIIHQTPEQVVLLKLGGSLKTYPVMDFLELLPENLSHGFRVQSSFGIDYRHQPDATSRVIEILGQALSTAFINDYGNEQVRSIKVEFQSAGTSSLDYVVLADFDGSLGSRYNFIKRRIQSICVDVCNDNGWVIPFTQITVHQAP
jgi:small-conductance mechanosensitive channel